MKKTQIEIDVDNGLWVPTYYGNWFKVARLLRDRLRTQEESPEKWRTLAEAQTEADRRNGRLTPV